MSGVQAGEVVQVPSLDGLSDSVRSKILLEYIGNESLDGISGRYSKGSMSTLVRLALSSKQWSRWVYHETPGLWQRIGAVCMVTMTDEMLAALLIRTNAIDVLEDLDLTYCCQVTGVGLEPIRGSIALRRINLMCKGKNFLAWKWSTLRRNGKQIKEVDLDEDAVMSIVESFPPFATDAYNDFGVGGVGSGLLSIVLPHQYRFEKSGKKRRRSYQETLIDLQKLYRKNFNQRIKGTSLPCPSCGASMQFWLHCPSLHEMTIKTYCTKCHREDEKFDYSADTPDDEVDIGILKGCDRCNQRFDAADLIVCGKCTMPSNFYSICGCPIHSNKVINPLLHLFKLATCTDYYDYATCGNCNRLHSNMVVCSMCDVANCSGCLDFPHYLQECGAHKCEGKLGRGRMQLIVWNPSS